MVTVHTRWSMQLQKLTLLITCQSPEFSPAGVWLPVLKASSDLEQQWDPGSERWAKSSERKGCEKPFWHPAPLCTRGAFKPRCLALSLPELSYSFACGHPYVWLLLTCGLDFQLDLGPCGCGLAWWSELSAEPHRWTCSFFLSPMGLCPLSLRVLPLLPCCHSAIGLPSLLE